MKVVFVAPPRPGQLESLREAFPALTVVAADGVEGQREALADADAIVGWPTREGLAAARRLRWVHITGAGIEGIRNVPELVERDDVTLTNSRGAHAPSIADHCLAFLLALARDFPAIFTDQREHRWERHARAARSRTLRGATLGLLGLGQIGSEVAKRALGFDVRLLGIDANPHARCPGLPEVWGLDRLDDLLGAADAVVVALPITPKTRGLLGARELALMKPSAYLCVMSRGGIVDQDALAAALREGRLAGAGLDATEPEPLPPEHPLWDAPNVIISPHSSYASQETYERLDQILRENLRRFVAGEPLLNLCDKRAGY